MMGDTEWDLLMKRLTEFEEKLNNLQKEIQALKGKVFNGPNIASSWREPITTNQDVEE